MRRLSFIITILGMSSLLIISFIIPPKSISSQKELYSLIPNQKVTVEGKIIKENPYKNYKLLELDNYIKLKCDLSCPSLLNKQISALAKLESYNNQNYLKILKVSYLKVFLVLLHTKQAVSQLVKYK